MLQFLWTANTHRYCYCSCCIVSVVEIIICCYSLWHGSAGYICMHLDIDCNPDLPCITMQMCVAAWSPTNASIVGSILYDLTLGAPLSISHYSLTDLITCSDYVWSNLVCPHVEWCRNVLCKSISLKLLCNESSLWFACWMGCNQAPKFGKINRYIAHTGKCNQYVVQCCAWLAAKGKAGALCYMKMYQAIAS